MGRSGKRFSRSSKRHEKDYPAQVLPLNITGVAYGGKGLARQDGKVYFVPHTIPGDSIEAIVTKSKSRFAEAKVAKFHKPSALREDSPCPHFGGCGGCSWQDVSLSQQKVWKLEFIQSAFSRIAKLKDIPQIRWGSKASADQYRNRIRLRCRVGKKGYFEFGYHQRGSHQFLPIDICTIADRHIQQLINHMIGVKAPENWKNLFQVEVQVICLDGAGRDDHGLLVTLYKDQYKDRVSFKELIPLFRAVPFVQWAGTAAEGLDAPWFKLDQQWGLNYYTRPGQFQQIHLQNNQMLRDEVREQVRKKLGPGTSRRVLDAYCGSGNLSLGLAADGYDVTGFESNPNGIATAEYNVTKNSLTSCHYFVSDGSDALETIASEKQSFDLVIADPPREGIGQAIDYLLDIDTDYLLLVGCDPTTLARDVGKLVAGNYVLEELVAFDFFPHTWHIETLAILQRTKQTYH